jgi:hypothetical protein
MAMGAIKSQMYVEKTSFVPGVVAVYNTIGGGGETINDVISWLLQNRVELDPTSGVSLTR